VSIDKTVLGKENIVSIKEATKNKDLKGSAFSKGLYDWVMFVLSFYVRVKEKLNIDFDSFVILQVVVSHSLYEINKTGPKTFLELGEQMAKLRNKKTKSDAKLTFASISDVLSLPRETVRRKVLNLCKKNILSFYNDDGIKIGPAYKLIYADFVRHTTFDISTLAKKWKKSGVLDDLLEMEQYRG
tara:strand:- start:383 stop:937 length:555 start_codon:yes stop_codon:yes gene_type:complete